MRRTGVRARSLARAAALCLAGLAVGSFLLLAGCAGGRKIAFQYPAERIDFGAAGGEAPSVYLGLIRDLRPEAQRKGEGKFFGITYPSDRQWEWPVTQIYREALIQDLSGTRLVELVPLPSQADYTLNADVLSFGSRLSRSPAAFVLPLGIGLGGGFALGSDSSDRVKRGAVLGVAALLALPLPTPHRAEAEVRLTLLDRQGEVVWERTCLGEVENRVFLTAVARNDQKLVNKYLTRALKRADACLLGQLRQALVGGELEAAKP